MHVWNLLYAARWKCRTQKWRKIRHLRTIAQLCRAISSQLRHISTIGKKLLSSNISSRCPYNMVNFGPLAAEIRWRVWGTHYISTCIASWQRYCTAVKYWASAKLCGVEQRAPPIFGRATITGIGPHSSFCCFFSCAFLPFWQIKAFIITFISVFTRTTLDIGVLTAVVCLSARPSVCHKSVFYWNG